MVGWEEARDSISMGCTHLFCELSYEEWLEISAHKNISHKIQSISISQLQLLICTWAAEHIPVV